MTKGWKQESTRHALAAKGMETGRKSKKEAEKLYFSGKFINLPKKEQKSIAKQVLSPLFKEEKLTTDQRLKQNLPLEVYETPNKSWRWEIYKKYQKDDDKQYARAFCKVFSPITREQMSSGYELGDVYISEIKSAAKKVSG